MRGIVALTETRAPTEDKVKTLPSIELATSTPCVPSTAMYEPQPVEVEFSKQFLSINLASRFCALSDSAFDECVPIAPEICHDESYSLWASISLVFTHSFADIVSSPFSPPVDSAIDWSTCLQQHGFLIDMTTCWTVNDDEKLNVFVDNAIASNGPSDLPRTVVFCASQFPKRRHQKMAKEEILRKWWIGPKTAEVTLHCTHQQGT
mmetsp:Transcript_19492/g.30030  ORF Transcript_19492/g.30030 Transcript_19492/m.30030 type:complete len:206 (+) Transcript_19492:1118-1735(+)